MLQNLLSIPVGVDTIGAGRLQMRCIKTVTPRKIEANRRNAKRSTGPRTERGKSTARFNAVTLGLFAKHIVIPICDGYKPKRNFRALLDGLHQEFGPEGFYEEWLVVKIAECMWRLRRATRCESGSVREAAILDRYPYDNQRTLELEKEIANLTEAEEQLQNSGTLSQRIYQRVAALLEKEEQKEMQAEKDDRCVETEFDRELFLTCITNRKEFLESYYAALGRIEGDRSDAWFDYNSLLAGDDMDRVLRYEERIHRQFDWAVQRLLESQERRKTSQPPLNTAILTTGQCTKRSQ
jgi:hypothetical protein